MKMKKIAKKLSRITLSRLVNDAVYTGVNYMLTGNVINAFAGLGIMKLVSATTFVLLDDMDVSPMKKSLILEAVLSIGGLIVNGFLIGNVMSAIQITIAMKVCIPINAWFFKNGGKK